MFLGPRVHLWRHQNLEIAIFFKRTISFIQPSRKSINQSPFGISDQESKSRRFEDRPGYSEVFWYFTFSFFSCYRPCFYCHNHMRCGITRIWVQLQCNWTLHFWNQIIPAKKIILKAIYIFFSKGGSVYFTRHFDNWGFCSVCKFNFTWLCQNKISALIKINKASDFGGSSR